MANISLIFISIQISVFGLIILLAFIYSLTILFVRRFHSQTNIFTLNLCLAVICCSLYWMTYQAMMQFNIQQIYAENTCTLLLYAQMMCTLQVPLALIIVSIHRLCSIVYSTKVFFKTKQWIAICLASQWIAGFILSLPMFFNTSFCIIPLWKRMYTLIIVVIVPSLSYVMINYLILQHVRSSSRRVRPRTTTIQTVGNNIIHHQSRISRRDIRLLQHMILMFCVFVGGWAPVYVMSIIFSYINIDLIVVRILPFLAELSLLCDILDLFVYNHEVRNYLKNFIFKCI